MAFLAHFFISEMINVGISTLHGSIINLSVEPNTVVHQIKQAALEASPFHLTPLAINCDLAHLMNHRGSLPADSPPGGDGVRLVHWNGSFLDDQKTLASQISSYSDDVFLLKLVFMVQILLTDQDMELVKQFAGGICERRVYMPQYCTEFIVMPVWGGFERSNHILGIFYQHGKTANHCSLANRGVDPREIASNAPVLACDILVPNATAGHTNVAAMD